MSSRARKDAPQAADSGAAERSSSRVSAETAASTPRDTVLIHGASADGAELAVLRAREDRVEAGVLRKVREGEPLTGELVRLTPRPEFPLLCDVAVEYTPDDKPREPTRKRPQLSHGGPAQVATPSYRANWDAIWAKRKEPGGAPN